ncbi:MAG: ABC-2 transporter permease [Actinobacteria bacterium]|nr:ABC-2 transporter permease [Actinomycetota bacterium]
MKSMLMSDLLLIDKKHLAQIIVIGFLVSSLMSISVGNLFCVLPIVVFTTTLNVAFTLLALDERANWQGFRLALPVSRKQVVIGRYASFALFTCGGLIAGLIMYLLMVLAGHILGFIPILGNLWSAIGWKPLVATGAASLVLMLLLLSIILPLSLRFGMVKAVRLLPLGIAFTIPAFAAISADDANALPSSVVDFGYWVQTDAGILCFSLILVALTLIIYLLSCALSIRLYAKREL